MANWFILIFWMVIYNDYFGNNWLPASDAEMICDGLTTLMVLLITTRKSI